MDTLMMWRLIGAFINVTVLTRAGQLLLRRRITDPRKRAYAVAGATAAVDFLGMWAMYDAPGAGLYYTLFYYLPFIVMWLLKDVLDASRQKRKASMPEGQGS